MSAASSDREKVLGFGGFFFRAKDPATLADWYRDNLGIDKVPGDYDTPCWRQEATRKSSSC